MLTVRSNNGCASRKALNAVNQNNTLGVAHRAMYESTRRGQVGEYVLHKSVMYWDMMYNVAGVWVMRRDRFCAARYYMGDISIV